MPCSLILLPKIYKIDWKVPIKDITIEGNFFTKIIFLKIITFSLAQGFV